MLREGKGGLRAGERLYIMAQPRIVHMSYSADEGGAARAAYRQHEALARAGLNSSMFVLRSSIQNDEHIYRFEPSPGMWSRLLHIARKVWWHASFERYSHSRPSDLEIFTGDRSPFGNEPLLAIPEADILNFHWVAQFVDYRSMLGALGRRAPMIWTLHDMNPFTGGCHYALNCDGYTRSCGACPQLGSRSQHDLSRKIWKRKWRAFQEIGHDRLHVVTPSQWLADRARESSLFSERPIRVIPYGLDTELFSPRDPQISRELLGLHSTMLTLLFVSDSVSNSRKGYKLLKRVLARLKDMDHIQLVSVGEGANDRDLQANVIHAGRIDNERLLSFIYSAADVFVIPSLADNLPNTVLESMACGTPVVGFDVGGIPEMVRPRVTGLLAPVGDCEALGEAIRSLLSDHDLRREMAENCRRIAVEKYSLEVCARAYEALYRSVLNEQPCD